MITQFKQDMNALTGFLRSILSKFNNWLNGSIILRNGVRFCLGLELLYFAPESAIIMGYLFCGASLGTAIFELGQRSGRRACESEHAPAIQQRWSR